MTPRAFIAGCSGLALSARERAFFRDTEPFGFILFKRNVESPDQVRALALALRETVGRDAPILVDQEGGRVQRLGPPHWPRYPAGRAYGRLAPGDRDRRAAAARLGARLIAHDLRSVGITVDCLPVLDVPSPGAHDIIGDRAYSEAPDDVAALGRAAAEGLIEGGVLPVMKHVPGHGRAEQDSHEALPRVDAPIEALRERDFPPFRSMAEMPLAMTAHVVFEAIDPDGPATTSRRVVDEIIRGEIGFDGLLLTDDLSMRALAGTFRERAEAAFRAGCDVALHCNGDLGEAADVAAGSPRLAGRALARAEAALRLIGAHPPGFDVVDARQALATALAEVA